MIMLSRDIIRCYEGCRGRFKVQLMNDFFLNELYLDAAAIADAIVSNEIPYRSTKSTKRQDAGIPMMVLIAAVSGGL